MLTTVALLAADMASAELPRLSWSHTAQHPGFTAAPACIVGDAAGRVDVLWASSRREPGSAPFVIQRLVVVDGSAADGLVSLVSSPPLTGVLGGCALLPGGGLIVVGGAPSGRLGYFVVGPGDEVASTGTLDGTSRGTVRKVVRRSNGELVAVGNTETGELQAVQFDQETGVVWTLDAGPAPSVELLDALESAGGALVVAGRSATVAGEAGGDGGEAGGAGLWLAEVDGRGRVAGSAKVAGSDARLFLLDGSTFLLANRPAREGGTLALVSIAPGPTPGRERVLDSDFLPVLALESAVSGSALAAVEATGSLHPGVLVLEAGASHAELLSDAALGAGVLWLAAVENGFVVLSEDFLVGSGAGAAGFEQVTRIAKIAAKTGLGER